MKFATTTLVAAVAATEFPVFYKETMLAEKYEKLRYVDLLEAEEIVEGLVKGAIKAENFKSFIQCGADLTDIKDDAEKVVADFKAGGAKNIFSGLETVADMLLWARETSVECNPHNSADWSKLEALANELKHPKTFVYNVGKNLILNGSEITGELEAAVLDFEQKDYKSFGFDLGEAVAKTLLGASQPPNLNLY